MTITLAGKRGHEQGFTLLELLVAMAIFAVVGALALGGLNAVLGQQALASKQLERLHQVQRAVRVITNDFTQLNPRYVRDVLGSGTEAPLVAGAMPCPVDAVACLSRDGWRNPFWTQPRGTLQRVQYRVTDKKLIRDYWPVMDHTLSNEPRSETLLDSVETFAIEYLDTQAVLQAQAQPQLQWRPQWPPVSQSGSPETGPPLPQAVRITIKLTDWGEIVREIEVAA